MKIAKKLCLFLTFTCLVLLFVFILLATSAQAECLSLTGTTIGCASHPFWSFAVFSGLGAFLSGIGALFL